MNLKGTKSEQNLKTALAGESMARNKYTFYAAKAREEGRDGIAELFERMARNEMAHAQIWFKLLNGGIKGSDANLQDAAAGEYSEWRSMYPGFAREAREEGIDELAEMFEKIAQIEKDHEYQFLLAYAEMISGKKSQAAEDEPEEEPDARSGYRCIFCGAVYEARPDVCGVCEAIGSFERCAIKK